MFSKSRTSSNARKLSKPIEATIQTMSDDDLMSEKHARSGSRTGIVEKKPRSNSVGSKASIILTNAKNSLHLSHISNNSTLTRKASEKTPHTPLQKLGKQDPELSVPQGGHNNSAGESHPGPRSTFRVGVWEDKNKKCRRTMEDTHAFLYNFLHTPAPTLEREASTTSAQRIEETAINSHTSNSNTDVPSEKVMETDNGYFAVFDGHAGTFAADWCGKKLHIILEDMIRTNPNASIPELFDRTFTNVDSQLEKLPLKNSGCTAVIAVLRWEDRVPSTLSAMGSAAIAPATVVALKAAELHNGVDGEPTIECPNQANRKMSSSAATHNLLKSTAIRQRVLYTANVGDARIVLCRKGKALRLSYDHKGSDANEGKRVSSAGGMILNNRVNGVLAVTRALGDNYIKDLVTSHPFTTETIIQPDNDEFIILACDGIWDVCSDQEAVQLTRDIPDPTIAAKKLVDHALSCFTTDNLSCMIVRLNKSAILNASKEPNSAIGVEGDPNSAPGEMSELEKIIGNAKKKANETGVPGIGISGCNSGKGHESRVENLNKNKITEEKVSE
ncbi:BgTH12-07074 [Blumeria graminis f. sp. triticale]|uniref:Bgt-1027 n=3 Tax=Blumeria graminis TaxID=34373 RepID=A0A061HE98_BLUGR|nr:Type 2C protein phosphatase [Blumeria graminis f. sp. tritici 96224]CAD6506144.1 BgTH12-07074 [Blumeria graminis f. sp. triticale]VDB94839.1 Bgt-1027 [Blumeria graminis f. sp. tritici]